MVYPPTGTSLSRERNDARPTPQHLTHNANAEARARRDAVHTACPRQADPRGQSRSAVWGGETGRRGDGEGAPRLAGAAFFLEWQRNILKLDSGELVHL